MLKIAKLFMIGVVLLSTLISCSQQVNDIDPTWRVDYQKDEFGDQVGDPIAYSEFKGKFSNSLVFDQDLKVTVTIRLDGFSIIKLYESDGKPIALPKLKRFELPIKNSEGSKKYIKHHSSEYSLYTNENILLNELLSQPGPLRFYVDASMIDESYDGIYRFSINPEGLKEVLDKIQ